MAACGCAGRAALGSGNTRACCGGTVPEECPERHEAKSGDVQFWWYTSDVLDTICYEFLPDSDNIEAPPDFFNWIVPDMAGLVVTTEDFGIGMTEYEFAGNLGIIVQSGTKASMEAEAACGGCFTKASMEAAAACGGCFKVRQNMGGLVIATEDFGMGMTEYECVGNFAQSGTEASIKTAVACGGRFTVRQFGVGFGSRDLGSDCARGECILGDDVQLIEKAGKKEVIDFDGVTRPQLGEIIVCMRRAAARSEPRSSLFSWQVLFCIVCFSLGESIRFCRAVTELCERLHCALPPAEGGCPTLGSLLACRYAPVPGPFPPPMAARGAGDGTR